MQQGPIRPEKAPPSHSEIKTSERRIEKDDAFTKSNLIHQLQPISYVDITRPDFLSQLLRPKESEVNLPLRAPDKDSQIKDRSDVKEVLKDVHKSDVGDQHALFDIGLKKQKSITNNKTTISKLRCSSQGANDALFQRYVIRENHFNVSMSPHNEARGLKNPLHVPQVNAGLIAQHSESYGSEWLVRSTVQRNTPFPVIPGGKQGGIKRREALNAGRPVSFEIPESNAKHNAFPWFSIHSKEMVSKNEDVIEKHSINQGLKPEMVKAIIYLESTHGWYDVADPEPDTILPGNLYVDLWKGLGFEKKSMHNSEKNIEATTKLLGELWRSTKDPTVEKVASLYHDIKVTKVTEYGKTVVRYMETSPWKQRYRLEQLDVKVLKEGAYYAFKLIGYGQAKMGINMVRPAKSFVRDPESSLHYIKAQTDRELIRLQKTLSNPYFWLFGH